jgi:hypothetical protein
VIIFDEESKFADGTVKPCTCTIERPVDIDLLSCECGGMTGFSIDTDRLLRTTDGLSNSVEIRVRYT